MSTIESGSAEAGSAAGPAPAAGSAPAGLPALDGAHPLDPGLKESFDRDGHVMVEGLATPEEVTAYRPFIEEATDAYAWDKRPLEERDTYGKAFLQAAQLWRRREEVARFTLSPRFARVAAELLGVDGVRIYHDQALFKEAGGGHTPWHQDQVYWPLDTDRTVTMWIPLDDVSAEIGGMTFASGTQRMGDLSGLIISDESHDSLDRLVKERDIPCHTYRTVALGNATFHAGWTLHSAGPNPTTRVRPVMTVIYFADGMRAIEPTNDHQGFDLQLWLKPTQPGEVIDSDRNPLAWHRRWDAAA